jgi:hypothetical protein
MPADRYEALPPPFTLQIDGVDEVTAVTPEFDVDTMGINDPPGSAEVGIFEIVGIGPPTAPATPGMAACNAIATTKLAIPSVNAADMATKR